jgi:hypothetical protein
MSPNHGRKNTYRRTNAQIYLTIMRWNIISAFAFPRRYQLPRSIGAGHGKDDMRS